MYKLLLTFLFFGSSTLYGQTNDSAALKFTEYESAKYPGGSVEFSKFIDLYFVYPRRCMDDEIDGSVLMLFGDAKKALTQLVSEIKALG